MPRALANWLKSYMEYASITEAPEYCHFWTGVFTIAGALRRRVWFDQLHFQWTPNFYLIFVAPSGIIAKSTTLDVGMRLLRQVKGIKFGPDVVTWQSLTEELENAKEAVMMPDGFFHEMSCLTIASSEFGTLLNPKDKDMVENLTAMWDSRLGVWRKATKTSGKNVVVNPWLNMAGCTTPAWVKDSFSDFHLLGGFASRIVWVYADEKSKLVPYLDDVIRPADFLAQEKALVKDLEEIAALKGQFVLDDSARQLGREWYVHHWNNPPKDLDREKFGGYISRKQGHIHKLAMILKASESNDLIIDRRTLDMAIQITDSIEGVMNRVFEGMSSEVESKNISELVLVVRAKHSISRKDLYGILYKRMGYEAFEKALIGGVEASLIEVVPSPTGLVIRPVGESRDGSSQELGKGLGKVLSFPTTGRPSEGGGPAAG